MYLREQEGIGRVTDVHFGLATLDDVVGVIEGAKHRHAYHGALLLKKASAWHGAWESAHLQHDHSLIVRLQTLDTLVQRSHQEKM